jgi:hypothetical protein
VLRLNWQHRASNVASKIRTKQRERQAVREEFQSGQAVPCSGIYKAAHAARHQPPHYVIALDGDTFPACRECCEGVRFQLALYVTYIKRDPQFA